MKKLEYFINEEEKKRALAEEKAELIPVEELPPYIPFEFDAFALIERSQLLTCPQFYFDCQFEEKDAAKTVIFCDGTSYLPAKIAKLVLENGWFCLATRQIDANKPYHEEVSLAIYYDDKARVHFADMVHPAGACSEIFVSIYESSVSYLVSYNHHPLVIGNDDDYECEVKASTQHLGAIDFKDTRGIDYLAQCLNYRVSQLCK